MQDKRPRPQPKQEDEGPQRLGRLFLVSAALAAALGVLIAVGGFFYLVKSPKGAAPRSPVSFPSSTAPESPPEGATSPPASFPSSTAPESPPEGATSPPAGVVAIPMSERGWEWRINRQVGSLRVGLVMYLIPAEMVTGRRERIVVRVSRKAEGPLLLENLSARGTPKVEPVKVGTFMLARLTGNGFEIEAKTGEKQAVADPYAEWMWDVVPVQSGEQQLDLTVAVRLKLPNGVGEEEVYLPVITRTVNVRVDPVWSGLRWAQENPYISGPLVVALVIFLARAVRRLVLRFRKGEEPGIAAGASEEGEGKGSGAAAGKVKKEEQKPPAKGKPGAP